MTDSESQLIEIFRKKGQGHVFQFLNELDESERASLLNQAVSIDLDELDNLVEKYVKGKGGPEIDFSVMEPSAYIPHYEHIPAEKDKWLRAKAIGEVALRGGKVATFTVAGGQGTRLGYDGPKGTFPVTPVTQSSLFEVFAKKIAFTGKRYEAPIHWFIMTSLVNHEQTVSFFEEQNYFGLKPDQVHIFNQGLMPAVDFEGKLILDRKNNIVMTPDGHGGSLRALNRSGNIAFMKANGIEMLSYFQVDNPLIKCIDPYFVGFHVQNRSEMSSKMIPKVHSLEKVGHFCDYRGKMMVVEYSDLPIPYQEQHTENGELRFIAGSIAIHIFSVDFVERLGGADASISLPFHKAEKKIPFVDKQGRPVKPESSNGVKFEMFVFDALPFANDPVLIETLRDEDFSPVKNAEGEDSPVSCKRHQLRLFAKWLKRVGVELPTDEDGVPAFDFEIDPLFACDSDTFVEEWNKLKVKPVIEEGTVLKAQD
jgi:UDP-N-acetylglucosamine/UDP-N-acetylgalactosamine diphosphorylase